MNTAVRPSLGSLAAMAALAVPAVAEAQVVLSGFSPITATSNASFLVDIDGNGTSDFRFFNSAGEGFLEPFANSSNLVYANDGNVLFNLTAGTTITPGVGDAAAADLGFFIGTSGYAGVTFQRSGSDHAGWLLFDFTGSAPVLQSGAWENTAGAGLAAGAIPEPAHVAGGIGLLAGLAAWMRRRKTGA